MTASRLLGLMNRREVSSVQLVRLFIERCRTLNPRINAVVTLVEERALSEAAESDRRRSRNENMGALEGLPFTVKDTLATQGVRSTAGTHKLTNYIPERDAATVAHLRAAGAIMIGKTNVPELGGDIDCENPVFGRSSNPWDNSRTPGGSSGGEGAAVASGLNAFGLGRTPVVRSGFPPISAEWQGSNPAGRRSPARVICRRRVPPLRRSTM